MSFASIIMFILMLCGGGDDFLGVMSTDAYWRAKGGAPTVEILRTSLTEQTTAPDVSADIEKLGSTEFKVRQAARQALASQGAAIADQLKKGAENKDPEISATCKELLTAAATGNQAQQLRKLMAIRTLGEMKDKDSLPSLTKLKDSKDPFVAEYATRALEQITGVKLPGGPATSAFDDTQLLPKDTGSVAQIRSSSAGLTMEKLLDAMPEILQMQDGQKPEDARKALIDKMTTGLLSVLETTGDIRLAGVTAGMSQDIGPNSGWVCLIIRGQFDRDAIAAAIKAADQNMQVTEEDHVVIVAPSDQSLQQPRQPAPIRLLLPSNQLAVLIVGPTPASIANAQKSLLAALKTGKGDFAPNADLAALLKQVDRTRDLWAVVQLPAIVKDTTLLAGIDSLLIQATRKGTSLTYEVKGLGSDSTQVADSAKAVQSGLESTIEEGKAQMARMANMNSPSSQAQAGMIKRILAIMETIKITSADKTATLTGQADLLELIGSITGSFARVEVRPVPANPPQPMPIPQ